MNIQYTSSVIINGVLDWIHKLLKFNLPGHHNYSIDVFYLSNLDGNNYRTNTINVSSLEFCNTLVHFYEKVAAFVIHMYMHSIILKPLTLSLFNIH